jgi:hypothetical protein
MRRDCGLPVCCRVCGYLAILGSALAICTATVALPMTARADDAAVHLVTYTVTADQSLDVDIYYRDVDPPNWADYSHNPYQFSPKAQAPLDAETPWVRGVTLADPDRWAMVSVSRVSTRPGGIVGCELAIDGVVVRTAQGPAGALCSLRHW